MEPGGAEAAHEAVWGAVGGVAQSLVQRDEGIAPRRQAVEEIPEDAGVELAVVNEQDLRNLAAEGLLGEALEESHRRIEMIEIRGTDARRPRGIVMCQGLDQKPVEDVIGVFDRERSDGVAAALEEALESILDLRRRAGGGERMAEVELRRAAVPRQKLSGDHFAVDHIVFVLRQRSVPQ